MKPEPGTMLRVGEPMDYAFRAFFEFSRSDPSEDEYASASLEFETSFDYPSDGSRSFPITMLRRWQGLEGDASNGTVEAAGSLLVPPQTTFCGYYEWITVTAYIGFDSEPRRQESEKNAASGLEVEVEYPVDGSVRPGKPCTYQHNWARNFTYVWGQSLSFIKVVNVAEDASIDVIFGEGRPGRVWKSEYDDGIEILTTGFSIPPSLTLEVIVPVGSTGGDLQVLVDGVPTLWGGGAPSHYPIPERRDIGDPKNDRWHQALEDIWTYDPGVHVPFWGPELSLTLEDRVPDPDANSFGRNDLGRGDWWLLPVEGTYDLCVVVETLLEQEDELELLLTDAGGVAVSASHVRRTAIFPEGTYDQHWLRLPVATGDSLRLWVAPKEVRSRDGWYGALAQPCSSFEDAPLGAPASSPHGATRAPKVPPIGITRR